MNYCFKSEVKAIDCWKSTMRHTYHSMVGVINIVFTCAMFGLAVAFLKTAKPLEATLIILGCMWFTVFQPIGIYLQHRKIIKNMPQGLELCFNTQGMHVLLNGKQEDIPWKKLARIAIEPNMIIFYSDARHGYILTNKNMGQERKSFINFVKEFTD